MPVNFTFTKEKYKNFDFKLFDELQRNDDLWFLEEILDPFKK